MDDLNFVIFCLWKFKFSYFVYLLMTTIAKIATMPPKISIILHKN